MQVGEQRRSRIGLDVGPGAFATLLQNAAIDKGLEIPLETRGRRSEKLRQL